MNDVAARAHVEIEFRQSNHEGHLIDWLQEAAASGAHAVILNPGGLTHTSVALLDAIKSIPVPVIEVHLSNPHAREAFRHKSYVGMGAKGTIAGFGPMSYMLALEAALEL
jgi:3-dehydroquinate dehydratase-2